MLHGCVLYRTKVPAGAAGTLKITELHDYGLIFLDGKGLVSLDRRHKQNFCNQPALAGAATLDILVEAMGHVNYRVHIHDRKGITQRVELDGIELLDWAIFRLPLDAAQLASLAFGTTSPIGPAFYRGNFDLAETGDTYLDVSRWGKGMVWVNGHNLGRFVAQSFLVGLRKTLVTSPCIFLETPPASTLAATGSPPWSRRCT